MEFSLKLVEILFGSERRDMMNKGVLAKVWPLASVGFY